MLLRQASALSVCLTLLAAGCQPKLTPEEQQVFEEAQKVLRSDDYTTYANGEKKLLAILEKYPDYAPAIVWLTQMYCAWGEALGFEVVAFKLAQQNKARELENLRKVIEQSKSKSARAAAQAKFDAARTELEAYNKAGKLKDEESRKRLASAKEWAKKGTQVDYDKPELHRAIADHARITERWADVEQRLAFVKRNKPDSAGYQFIYGAMLLQKDRKPDDAIPYFEQALKLDPAFTKAQYFLALSHDKKDDDAKAADAMKKVLEMSPGHPGAKAYLGMITTLQAARAAAAQAELAGTDKEQVAAGDEVNPPASSGPPPAAAKGKKKK